MIRTRIAVVGGGVAGLAAARLLHADGLDVRLFEARERLGGRVLTVDETGALSSDGFDLGPSWIWPRMQPSIAALVDELQLPTFLQCSDGDVVFERMSREPAQRYRGEATDTGSLRLVGGSAALVGALAADLPVDAVHLLSAVTSIALTDSGARLTVREVGGDETDVIAEQVVLAVPPRIAEATITFSPDLPDASAAQWRATPTWMAPHAKFFAIYDRPFWRDAGCSGSAQSMVGPMLEIHDATTASGQAALFGFLGIGAVERSRTADEEITAACLSQLERLFGPEAASPRSTIYKDWAADRLTATEDDPVSSGHAHAPDGWLHGEWSARLVLASSETSPHEAGYLAGAIEAASLAATTVRDRLRKEPAGR